MAAQPEAGWLAAQARDARTANVAHLRATDSMGWRNFTLGAIVTVLSAVVASTGFATLHTTDPSLRGILAGFVMLAAALSALQTYMRYGNRAAQHREASRNYGVVVRQVALTQEKLRHAARLTADIQAEIAAIEKALDAADRAAPNVSPFIWAWAVASVDASRTDGDLDDRAATTLNRGLWPRIVWQFTHRIPLTKRSPRPRRARAKG
jgi:hypothetical protein